MLPDGSTSSVNNGPPPLATSTPASPKHANVALSAAGTSAATPVSTIKAKKLKYKPLKNASFLQITTAQKRYGSAVPSDTDAGEIAIFKKDLRDLEDQLRQETSNSQDPEEDFSNQLATKSKLLIQRRRVEAESNIQLRAATRALERCVEKVKLAKEDPDSFPKAVASLKTAETIFNKDIVESLTALRRSWWREGVDPEDEKLTAAQEEFNTLKEDLDILRKQQNSGDGLKCRTIDLTPFVGDAFNGEKELYPSWREGWKKATEHLVTKYKATEADLYNQLIRHLAADSQARQMAKAKGGVKGEYKEALNALDEAYGDPISLAIQAMSERNISLEAAPDKLKRLHEMSTRLEEEGAPMLNLLYQQLMVRMVRTSNFDATAAWNAYIKRKKLRAKDDPNIVSQNNTFDTDNSVNSISHSFQTFDVKEAYSITGLSAFCNDLAADEASRSAAKPQSGSAFLAKGEQSHQRSGRPQQPGKHLFTDNGTLIGCVKHGPKSTHTSMDCQALSNLTFEEWEELCGKVCRKCATFRSPHTCHHRCATQGCGKPHLTSRHHLHSGWKRSATGPTAAPPPKKGKFQKPKGKTLSKKENPKKTDHGKKPQPKKDKKN